MPVRGEMCDRLRTTDTAGRKVLQCSENTPPLVNGQFADPNPRLIVTDRLLGPPVENEVAEVSVSIQAAEIGLAEIHQDLVRSLVVARVLPVVGFADGIRERIFRVRPGQHLLHLELLPRPAGDDWLGPVVDRLTLLAPVVLQGIPRASVFELKRNQS